MSSVSELTAKVDQAMATFKSDMAGVSDNALVAMILDTWLKSVAMLEVDRFVGLSCMLGVVRLLEIFGDRLDKGVKT